MMIKSILALLFTMWHLIAYTQGSVKENIRTSIFEILNNEYACKGMYIKLKNQKYESDPTMRAYKGLITATMARYTINTFEKLKYFNTGKADIEASIANRPNDIELRFIRVIIQDKAPFILSYSSNLQEDKNKIINEYNHIENSILKNNIREYLLHSNLCTAKEKEKLLR